MDEQVWGKTKYGQIILKYSQSIYYCDGDTPSPKKIHLQKKVLDNFFSPSLHIFVFKCSLLVFILQKMESISLKRIRLDPFWKGQGQRETRNHLLSQSCRPLSTSLYRRQRNTPLSRASKVFLLNRLQPISNR